MKKFFSVIIIFLSTRANNLTTQLATLDINLNQLDKLSRPETPAEQRARERRAQEARRAKLQEKARLEAEESARKAEEENVARKQAFATMTKLELEAQLNALITGSASDLKDAINDIQKLYPGRSDPRTFYGYKQKLDEIITACTSKNCSQLILKKAHDRLAAIKPYTS